MKQNKLNIIGDIHGRTNWKEIVRTDAINVFVGDYFSPYDNISFDACRTNFMDIIAYKMQYPETIMLIGNHDIDHWYVHERYSRFDSKHFNDIYELFEENKDFLQAAYYQDNVLVTHAGVSQIWYERYKLPKEDRLFFNTYNINYIGNGENEADTIDEAYIKFEKYYTDNTYNFLNKKPLDRPNKYGIYYWNNKTYLYNKAKDLFEEKYYNIKEVCDEVNKRWNDGNYFMFNFESNCGPSDCYGYDETHGPMWIRPTTLLNVNIFEKEKYWQVVGHTQFNTPVINEENRIAFCDCLGNDTASILFENNIPNINK